MLDELLDELTVFQEQSLLLMVIALGVWVQVLQRFDRRQVALLIGAAVVLLWFLSTGGQLR